jgi:hypothetical protein
VTFTTTLDHVKTFEDEVKLQEILRPMQKKHLFDLFPIVAIQFSSMSFPCLSKLHQCTRITTTTTNQIYLLSVVAVSPPLLLPSQSTTLLFPKSLAFFHLQYNTTASFNTTNKQPPTKLLPHFSFKRPLVVTFPVRPNIPRAVREPKFGSTRREGRVSARISPIRREIAGKKSAPITVEAMLAEDVTFPWISQPPRFWFRFSGRPGSLGLG